MIRFSRPFLLCLSLWMASPALAVRTVIEHIGAVDPETEGWTSAHDPNNLNAGGVFNDMGFDAWEVLNFGAFSRYDYTLAAADSLEMATTGFRATTNMRNLLTPDDPNDLGNVFEVSLSGLGQWTLLFGADGAGNPILHQGDVGMLGGTPIPLNPSITGDSYREFQMVYDPGNSTTDVELFVDGISHGMMTNNGTIFGDRFNFGNSDGGSVFNSRWNLVRLETDLFTGGTPPIVGPVLARHFGAEDPVNEGWTTNDNGINSTSPVFGDMGFDAWNQTDPAGFARYDRSLDALPVAAMLDRGFRARANLRNLRTDDDPNDLSAAMEVSLDALGQFTLLFGTDSAGNPILHQGDLCCTGGTAIALNPPPTGTGYHVVDLVYDPDVNATEVEVLVDGTSHGFLQPAATSFGNRFNFGDSDGGSVDLNWNLVELVLLTPVACDFTGDGNCDVADINHMYAQGDLVAGRAVPADDPFDLNGDLNVNNGDLDQWLSVAATENGYGSPFRRGDTDDVGATVTRDVDITDFNSLSSNFRPSGTSDFSLVTWDKGNFDGDNDIDITDFSTLSANFSSEGYSAQGAVPEPSTLAIVGLALLMLSGFLTGRR